MCGIAGFVNANDAPNARDGASVLEHMLTVITHRGPDDQGTLIADNVAIGMRRLSIIDLSRAGNQPMAPHVATASSAPRDSSSPPGP